jgi:flavin-dependent dehydrogenase
MLFGKWYAYIFPHLGLSMARVGSGGSITWLHDEHVKLEQNMDIWLKSMNINVQGATTKRALINADYQGYDFTTSHLGKVFLCGDAAGLAFYLSGEGIHQALVSGSEIGKIIVDNNYKSKLLSELIHRKEQEVKSITDHNKKGLQEFFIKIYNRAIKLKY